MAKRGFGSFVVVVGILCVAAALALTVFNIRTDTAALSANSELLDQLHAAEPDKAVNRLTAPIPPTASTVPTASTAQNPLPDKIPGQAAVEVEEEEQEYDPTAMNTVEINGNRYIGTITFPVFGLELAVMDECTDESLATAPGRYAGSVEYGSFVIGGHNYVSHFGRLNRLREGNEILFTDVDGNKTLYEVAGAEVIDGWANDLLITDEWDLSLFTCTFSGTQRYVVRCMKVE